jgi:hypothetical protein
MTRLSEINIYPIKSTRVISLQQARVQPRGIEWDRRWMLVDADNKFITARQFPRLAMVETRFLGEQLQISAPGCEALLIPLADAGAGDQQVSIWRDHCLTYEVSHAASAWFSAWLGSDCRLMRLSEQDQRPVDPEYSRPGDQVSLADGYPLLIIGEASLRDLNSRLQHAVSMKRFRPNLVVATDEPFIEDSWQRIRIGELEFELVKACSRCVFTTVDPQTGEKDPRLEPLRTLGSYRRRPEGGVFFGQNAIPRSLGMLQLNSEVEVLG